MNARQTVQGLRSRGLWPPAGFETVPGPWDHSVWASDALPLLREVAEHTGGEMHIGGPLGEGEESPRWRPWHTALLLAEASLVQASSVSHEAIFLRGLSPAGEDALEPGSADPLDEAQAALSVGMLREASALVAATLDEQVLTPLAVSAGVALRKNNGKGAAKTLGALNVELRDAGSYGTDDYQQVVAWLERRNKLAHDLDVLVTADEVAARIDGVRAFRTKTASSS